MTTFRHTLIGLSVALASPARAQPTTEVTACSFEAGALSSALALEERASGKPSSGSVHVTCEPDGSALVRVERGAETLTRSVDLTDVPPSLAPRVVSLVVVAMLEPRPPPPPPTPAEPEPTAIALAPSPDAATNATGTTTATDSFVPSPASSSPAPRPSLLSRSSLTRPRGVSIRALARIHDSTSALWGGSGLLTAGPAAFGVTAATARVEHSLGTLTPLLLAARGDLTIACAGAACIAASTEIGRISVGATASDPMVVSARSLAALYLHAAAEVSFSARVADLDVAAVAALGTSRGVIARVDNEATAVLAGWTLGAALEVRR